ncbi:cycloartenol-C-24-methyltransferase-like [Syzygium oleosum]|uniref:cycloartenol-C-24-methyltransferase-like n=1 Tax=Syzygium oleosum TaxID=219896 RepID=UPI0024B93DA5|nr:cycloartenol-C-24-methyltransferase-like [Syzygium oleosum]
MPKARALDLAAGVGGTIDKSEVLSAINKWKGESQQESMKRHEHFLASQLALKPGYEMLDVGCGIGGPLREIARFSFTSITGLNNNEYQITRGEELNRIAGVDKTCKFVKADFMHMPFSDNTFDAVYAIEATCHAPNVAEIEIGNGLPDTRLTVQCIEALKQAGFEVIWEKDLADGSPVPWYQTLDRNHFSLSSFRATALGRLITRITVMSLECVGLAPEGSLRVLKVLERAVEGLVKGGRTGIFMPMYFFLCRKPQCESSVMSRGSC